MGGTFPVLEDGQICRHPVDTKSGWVTRVNQFVDFSEQRWVVRQPLESFILKYSHISRKDVKTLRDFFETQKGMFDTFVVIFAGTEYQECVFDQDDFSPSESDSFPNRFDVSLKIKQTRPNGYLWVPLIGVQKYPFIGNDVSNPLRMDHTIITQRPWTDGETFFTSKVDLETGMRYSYTWIASDPITGIQKPLRRWELNYPHITQDEAIVIYVFFHQMRGRLGTFKFDDPELYLLARQGDFSWDAPDPGYEPVDNCRFDMDEINLQFLGPNEFALKVLIAEFIPSPTP